MEKTIGELAMELIWIRDLQAKAIGLKKDVTWWKDEAIRLKKELARTKDKVAMLKKSHAKVKSEATMLKGSLARIESEVVGLRTFLSYRCGGRGNQVENFA